MAHCYRVSYLRNGRDKHTIIIPSLPSSDHPKRNMKHHMARVIHDYLVREVGGTIEIIKYERITL